MVSHLNKRTRVNGFKMCWQCFGCFSIILLTSCTPTTVSLPEHFTLPTPRETLKTSLPQALTQFQDTVKDDSNYYLGSGDQITLEVWGYPELSGQHVIGPDGKITLPLVGPFKLLGLSRKQAAQAISAQLSPYYMDLYITVRVDQYASNRILVLGRVARPGAVQFGMTAPTLLEAIALAGGFAKASGFAGPAQSLPYSRCAVFRGHNQIIWIELEPLFTGQDLSLNLKLKRNDIIYVPDIEERLIYVLGEVHRPGALSFVPHMSFIEALAKAGGPTLDAAPNRINIIRPSEGINEALSLDELITPNEEINVALQEGDIIYVPTNTIAKINYAINILNPFSTILGIYANIESIQADRQRRQLDDLQETLETERAALEAEREQTNHLE